jgi:peptidoglycan hydrolase CwlO-like protein
MANLSQVVKQLHAERKNLQSQLSKLDAAIQALSRNGSSTTSGTSSKPRRVLSANARRKIAAAQRARWAEWKAKQKRSA